MGTIFVQSHNIESIEVTPRATVWDPKSSLAAEPALDTKQPFKTIV